MLMKANGYSSVQQHKQMQMLKSVTQSFCRELTRYGAAPDDMVTVSTLMLDYVLRHRSVPAPGLAVHTPGIDLEQVADHWHAEGALKSGSVSLWPVQQQHMAPVATWLAGEEVQRNFVARFPQGEDELSRYFLGTSGHSYFAICFENTCVGVIGAEEMNPVSAKLEMKKFIGDARYRGRGIGKQATFLWLFYVFDILAYNKVYLYSLDTNIRNINLNARLGFELEGILLQDACIQGVYRDVVRMSLLRSRWEALLDCSVRPKADGEATRSSTYER